MGYNYPFLNFDSVAVGNITTNGAIVNEEYGPGPP